MFKSNYTDSMKSKCLFGHFTPAERRHSSCIISGLRPPHEPEHHTQCFHIFWFLVAPPALHHLTENPPKTLNDAVQRASSTALSGGPSIKIVPVQYFEIMFHRRVFLK